MTFSLWGCVRDYIKTESKQGYYYVVKKGDTLYRIAQDHSMSMDELVELNNLGKGVSITEGMALFIPGEESEQGLNREKEVFSKENKKDNDQKLKSLKDDTQSQIKRKEFATDKSGDKTGKTIIAKNSDNKKNTKTKVPEVKIKVHEDAKEAVKENDASYTGVPKEKEKLVAHKAAESSDHVSGETKTSQKDSVIQKEKFIWPLRGKVISHYGPQANGMYYNGIRIETPKEASINAAAGGHVIFSALLKDYGETVIIKHENNYATVYTHLSKRLVRVDQLVKRGEKIALIMPNSTGIGFIDFEIRINNKAKDPLLFMP
jgi:lipoprotein NlpD